MDSIAKIIEIITDIPRDITSEVQKLSLFKINTSFHDVLVLFILLFFDLLLLPAINFLII